MKKLSQVFILLSTIFGTTASAAPVSIDDEGFAVFYESPMNSNKGLILYINNKNCVGTYRIATDELVVATGELNARGPEKTIQLGTARFKIDCGPLQSLLVTRE